MTDHHPTIPPLVVAAAAVDEDLPGAWARTAAYLDAYKEPTGVLGRRKVDGDGNAAELRVEDLHVILAALEAVLDAHTGPDVGLADIDAKLDVILQHVTPKPVSIEFDAKLSEEGLAKFKADLAAHLRNGRLATGGIVKVADEETEAKGDTDV